MRTQRAVLLAMGVAATLVTACGGHDEGTTMTSPPPPPPSGQSLDTAAVLALAMVSSETAEPMTVDDGAVVPSRPWHRSPVYLAPGLRRRQPAEIALIQRSKSAFTSISTVSDAMACSKLSIRCPTRFSSRFPHPEARSFVLCCARIPVSQANIYARRASR